MVLNWILKFVLWASLSLFSPWALATIQAEVKPTTLTQGETFTLSLSQNSSQNGGVPDLTVLQKDFLILGTQRQVNYSLSYGQTLSSSLWIITLQAKKTGTLFIPAIKIGLDQSKAIPIRVEPNSPSSNAPLQPPLSTGIILSTQVKEKDPYLNQQITYRVRLYNSKRLLNADYQGPQVDNALLFPLGGEKRYQTIKNQRNYLVEEQNYAIFPQKSGPLQINSPLFTALAYDKVPLPIKAQNKPIHLTVKPIPYTYQGKTWLAAKDLQLKEQYEEPLQNLSQGSTLTRIVTLKGVAVPTQLLPTLSFQDSQTFQVYPEKENEDNQIQDGELVGSTQMKVTYLFNTPGKITIPELKVPWFNTRTGKEEVAILPPRIINITPVAEKSTQHHSPKITQSSKPNPKILSTSSNQNTSWALATFFATAWIVTLGLWGWQRKTKASSKKLYRNTLDQLKKACANQDPHGTKEALLKWANFHRPGAPFLNLSDLALWVTDPSLKKLITQLSQALYSKEGGDWQQGEELLKALLSIKPSSSKVKKTALPPIHPIE